MTTALRDIAIKTAAGILHERHYDDDGRPMRGYCHCDCLHVAGELVDAVAPYFDREPTDDGR